MRGISLVFILYLTTSTSFLSCNSVDYSKYVLQDLHGRPEAITLANPGGATVVAFMSPECPLCEYYSGPLNQMSADFANRGVQFFAVFPDTIFSAGEIDGFVAEFGIKWKVLLDPFSELRTGLNASVTPEVFVFNGGGEQVYSGAIDDWAVTVRKHRQVVRHRYLRNAIEAVLDGGSVDLSRTDPVGCLMQ